jgi:hypothetical protein
MARYEHLPKYKSAMDLAIFTENQVRDMSRYNKYTIGTEMRTRALQCLSFVVRANSTAERAPVLTELRIVLEELKQIIQLAKETRAMGSFAVYKEIMERLMIVMRQNEGWLKKDVQLKLLF